MKAPIAKKIPLNIEQHDTLRVDNYFWMRDENWKQFISGDLTFKDQDCLDYINAENEYKDFMMQDYKDVEKTLYNDILSRIKEDDTSFPSKKGDYLYYSRQEKGKNYSILCRKFQTVDAPEQVYFDINEEAKGKDLFIFGPSKINNSQTTMAYFYNETGSLEKTLRVRDLQTGTEKDWELTDLTGSLSWIDDENFYVVERDEFSRGKNVYKINVNEGIESKKLVFTKPQKYQDMFMGLSTTNDENYFLLELESGSTSVIYVSKKGSDEFSEFVVGENDIKFDLDHYQGSFYINTNMNAAVNFKVMKCDAQKSGWDISKWTEYIGETENIDIEGLVFYNKYLILTRKDNNRALSDIAVVDTETMETKLITMPDEAYDLEFIGDWDHLATKVRVIMDSPVSPYKYFELDLASMNLSELYVKEIPNYDASKYIVKREFAKARDGQEVPVTIVHLKDLKLDGNNKAMVYSYGSYGYGMPSYFNPNIFPLVDRGMVYCVAHIRGGDDKGNNWYLDGKMDKKMNTFYDFIDSCEHLVQRGYTTKGEIAINGGSAGGLLMGAVSNLRPDLFKAVIADVAFVDVINTISDESLPLTPPEWEEWGNPIENKEDFDYMMQYSPYDNVEAKDYPATLYNSGISDEQVTYWEPTKMVAKLRELKTDDNLLLLNMKMHAGHAGASKRYEWISEYAFNYAFILKAFGLK